MNRESFRRRVSFKLEDFDWLTIETASMTSHNLNSAGTYCEVRFGTYGS